MPSRVIADLLGLDASPGGRLKRWAEDLLSVNPAAPVEVIERVRETITTLEGYLREVIAARRRAPEDDLISDLIAAQIDGVALSDEEIVSNLFLLLSAGFETTSHLITSAVRLLARHPEVHDRVRAHPALIPAFIDEVLRLESPVQALLRLATADVKVGDGSIAAGSLVVALLGAANRDPRVFADPDRLDLDRPRSRLLSFGYGAHFCVGAALGRAEAQMALEALLALPGHFEEPPGQNDWTVSITNRGLRSYQVRLAG
jgi:cytochrome P450